MTEERPVFDADAPVERRAIIVRSLTEEQMLQRRQEKFDEARLRFEQRYRGLRSTPGVAAPDEQTARAHAEADVVDAARRSQAEIRRHVDSYLKEHFETIAADIASLLIDRLNERLAAGIAALQEHQAITLDRIGADMRAQLRAFARKAWGQTQPAPRASKKARSRAQVR